MNSSGISRRIDELGRIVIPVEIRRKLNIKEGENLEINVLDNSINLKKMSVIDNYKNIIEELGNTLRSVVKGHIIFTNREKNIYSTDTELLYKDLDNNLLDKLNIHEEFFLIDNLFEKKEKFYVYPYYISSDIAGFLIIYDLDDINKYKCLLRYIVNYIHDKLSIY